MLFKHILIIEYVEDK